MYSLGLFIEHKLQLSDSRMSLQNQYTQPRGLISHNRVLE